MKDTKQTVNEITTSDTFDVVNMGISDDPEDQKMILKILTDSLYTNKPEAVLREYGCNAADANVEAGKPDVPIVVHVPTHEEPYFSVRDVGGGMTEEQVLKVFCRLGRSTKRSSNAYTGMLGIGSKAGFAYGKSFLVTSFNKGTRTVYNCFLDSVDLPRMAKMDSRPSTEEDGIEVKLSVRPADIATFQTAAEHVYSYFKVPPIGVTVEKKNVICEGKNWRILTCVNRWQGNGDSVRMGNVGYDLDKIDGLATLRLGYATNIELDFEIGELEIAANREGLQYRDATKKALNQRCKEVRDELPKVISKMIEKASSLWEAKKAYFNLSGMIGSSQIISVKDIVWKGNLVISNTTLPLTGDGFTLKQFGTSYEPRLLANTIFVLRDKASYLRERVKAFSREKHNTEIIICSFKSKDVQTKFWKDYDLEGAPLVLLSSLPLPDNIKNSAPSTFNPKYSASCFTFVTPTVYSPKNSDYWVLSPTNLKTGKGIYVPILNFTAWNGSRYMTDRSLSNILPELRKAKILSATEPLYGIKDAAKHKLGSGWISLEEKVNRDLQSIITSPLNLQELANYKHIKSFTNIFFEEGIKFYPNSPAAAYVEARNQVLAVKNADLYNLILENSYFSSTWWKIQLPALPPSNVNIEKLIAELWKRYPMFKAIGHNSYTLRGLSSETVRDYVELVERALPK